MKISIILATLVLSGCGSIGYVMNTYGSVDNTEIDYEGHTYRIFDRKDISKVMITPSIGQAMRGGAIKGATFGGLNIQDDKGRFTNVATAYLQKDRPSEICEVKSGEMILDPQWEFVYLCTNKPKGRKTDQM
jgi:hypothetical protein